MGGRWGKKREASELEPSDTEGQEAQEKGKIMSGMRRAPPWNTVTIQPTGCTGSPDC